MNISDKTKIDNINNGKIKRFAGMVFGSFYKNGKVYVDLTWLGLMPLRKDGEKLEDIIKNQNQEIQALKEQNKKLNKKIETISDVLYKYLKDEEENMKEDF